MLGLMSSEILNPGHFYFEKNNNRSAGRNADLNTVEAAIMFHFFVKKMKTGARLLQLLRQSTIRT
jgi:hypothetical protein